MLREVDQLLSARLFDSRSVEVVGAEFLVEGVFGGVENMKNLISSTHKC